MEDGKTGELNKQFLYRLKTDLTQKSGTPFKKFVVSR